VYTDLVFDLYGTLVDISTDEGNDELWENIARMYCYKQANYTYDELKTDYIKYVQEEKQNVRERNPHFTHVDIKLEKVFKRLFKFHKDRHVKNGAAIHDACAVACCINRSFFKFKTRLGIKMRQALLT
jgi:putative hydrolase of the HAD superfamily